MGQEELRAHLRQCLTRASLATVVSPGEGGDPQGGVQEDVLQYLEQVRWSA